MRPIHLVPVLLFMGYPGSLYYFTPYSESSLTFLIIALFTVLLAATPAYAWQMVPARDRRIPDLPDQGERVDSAWYSSVNGVLVRLARAQVFYQRKIVCVRCGRSRIAGPGLVPDIQ